MKNRSVIRALALLLAVLLTGVFPVLAETYLEYSGALSATDARGLLGVDRDAASSAPSLVRNVSFLVCLDGEWTPVATASELYGQHWALGANRDMLLASQMEAAFGPYGFDADSYDDTTFVIGYDRSTSSVMWADTTPEKYYGEWALPMGQDITDYKVYYLPSNTATFGNTSVNDKKEGNTFYTLTLENEKGVTATFPVLGGTNLTTWLTEHADTTPTGWDRPLSYYHNWLNGSSTLTASDVITAQTTLTGARKYADLTLMVDGQQAALIERVAVGTLLKSLLAMNDSLSLSNGKAVHDYDWLLPSNTPINDLHSVEGDLTVYGTAKPFYTVTFVADKETGGVFRDASATYTSVQVLKDDCIPSSFFSKMHANLILDEGYALNQWMYQGTSGVVPMLTTTPIAQDYTVWASYTQQVAVRFWTSRDKTTEFPGTGTSTQSVDKLYQGVVPSESEIAAQAPAQGMRFRYWMDLNTGMVFSIETDRVRTQLDLYPVYERAIFTFVDETGTELDEMYDGDALKYDAKPGAGEYYAGLQVTREDGTTLLIPNGTSISREYLTTNKIPMTGPVDGHYTIVAEPIYKQQRTIVYHTGSGAEFILADALNQSTHTVTVNDSVLLLGALDIMNTVSPIGLALDGWATTEDATTAQFEPSASYEADELDSLVAAGKTLHLYPVWAQKENTVAVTFDSNYPAGAVDAKGNPLSHKTYTVYIEKDSKPTMPTLKLSGIAAPSNVMDGTTTPRYFLAGWSRDQNGNPLDDDDRAVGTNSPFAKTYGTYQVSSQYQVALSENTVFYAIWYDNVPAEETEPAYFYVRLNGDLPAEPGSHGPSDYLPGHHQWTGTIKRPVNIVNNVAEVEANILTEPSKEVLYEKLMADSRYNELFTQKNLTADDYNVKWYIDWYACKLGCRDDYHVDGRVRFADQVELNYYPNGGANVPAGTTHTTGADVAINMSQEPFREGFIFLGWDESPDVQQPTYPVGQTNTIYQMSTDKDLYAIWKADKITIPMNEKFKGKKEEQTNENDPTAPQDGRTYQFSIAAVSLPEGASYTPQISTSSADGSFTFDQINVTVEGVYIFEVRELIGTLPVQYDTSVYRLTINIVESEYGLGIAGYSFTKNNKILPVTGNNVDNVVFEFVNRTDVRSVSVSKDWADNNNQDGKRPDSVRVALKRSIGGLYDDTTFDADPVTLSAANGWTYTWENQDIKSKDGPLYEYYVVEDAVPLYETSYSGDMNSGLVITNTHVPQTVDFHVVKLWDDRDIAEGYRPETLTYTLTGAMPNGTIVQTVSSGEVAAPWSYTFQDIPVYNLGQQLLYTVTENEVPGYATSIETVGTGDGSAVFNITNTLQATHAAIAKQVTGNAGSLDAQFPFTAKVLDASGRLVTDIPAGDGYTVDADGTLHFALAHGEEVKLDMLPVGGFLVLNEEAEGYETTWSGGGTATANGMFFDIAEGGLAITVTNNRSVDIPTGVALDTVPYLLLMGLALLGLAGLQKRRRRV